MAKNSSRKIAGSFNQRIISAPFKAIRSWLVTSWQAPVVVGKFTNQILIKRAKLTLNFLTLYLVKMRKRLL